VRVSFTPLLDRRLLLVLEQDLAEEAPTSSESHALGRDVRERFTPLRDRRLSLLVEQVLEE